MPGMRHRHAKQRREQTNLPRWRSQGDSTSRASCGGISLSPRKTVGLGDLANPRRVHFKAYAELINSRIEPCNQGSTVFRLTACCRLPRISKLHQRRCVANQVEEGLHVLRYTGSARCARRTQFTSVEARILTCRG